MVGCGGGKRGGGGGGDGWGGGEVRVEGRTTLETDCYFGV